MSAMAMSSSSVHRIIEWMASSPNVVRSISFYARANTWAQYQKIIQPQGLPNDRFARSVAISADGSLILASRSDPSV